jgi:hypothetical protein
MVSALGLSDMLSIAQTIGIVGTMVLTLYFSKKQIQSLSIDTQTRGLNESDNTYTTPITSTEDLPRVLQKNIELLNLSLLFSRTIKHLDGHRYEGMVSICKDYGQEFLSPSEYTRHQHLETHLDKVRMHCNDPPVKQSYECNARFKCERGLYILMQSVERAKSPNGSVTFRFDSEILSKLRNEADQKRTSLNTLASQIFQSYVEYDMYASRAGMVSFPKSLLVRLMNRLNEQEVEQLSEYIAKNDLKEMILLIKNEYSLSAFLDMIESWLRTSGIGYRRDVIDGHQTFVIQHDMDKRWSMYFEKLIKYAFKDLNENEPIFNINDNSIAFRITAR